MADGQFRAGDVVMLKSGGPQMVVSAVSKGGETVDCVWFDKDQNRQYEEFQGSVLEHVDPADPGFVIAQ
jgi:uncharacterized protein YodC (DUF2158 family)